MLLYPPIKELLVQVPSRYMLVNLVASRARKLSSESEVSGEPLEEKAVSLAIREVASGTLTLEQAEEEAAAAVPEEGEESGPKRASGGTACPLDIRQKEVERVASIAKIAVSAATYAIDRPYDYLVPPSWRGRCGPVCAARCPSDGGTRPATASCWPWDSGRIPKS